MQQDTTAVSVPQLPADQKPYDEDRPAGGHLSETFLSRENKLIIAAVISEFMGTMFLVLVAVGVQVSTANRTHLRPRTRANVSG